MKNALFLPLAVVLGLPGPLSAAQAPGGPQPPPDGGMHVVLPSIFISSTPGAPFTATLNTESVQQLGDGSNITLKNHRAIARDKSGRVFQERRLLVPDDGRQESVVTRTEISDPVARTYYSCIPTERTCYLEKFSPLPASRPAAAEAPNREYLGKQSIGELQMEGTIETGVIESGAIGNDRPLLVKREFWYSPQLGFNLVSKVQDPRFGSQSFELSDIVLGDPDGKLFILPDGFKVIDLRRTTDTPSQASPPRN